MATLTTSTLAMARRIHCRTTSPATTARPPLPLAPAAADSARRRLLLPPPSASNNPLVLPPKRRPAGVTPARQRRKDKRAEEQGDGVDLRPSAPAFGARFASAVRAARGPRALGRLLGRRAYLEAAPGPALAAAMAVAAGLASGRVVEEVMQQEKDAAATAADPAVVLLSADDDSTAPPPPPPSPPFPLDSDLYPTRLAHCRAIASVCAAELRARLQAERERRQRRRQEQQGGDAPPPAASPLLLSPLDQARAAYSLARLGLYDPELLDLLLVMRDGDDQENDDYNGTRLSPLSSSSSPPPPAEALVGMAAALAAFSHPVPSGWLERWRVESFGQLGAMDAQQLATAAFALVRLTQQQLQQQQQEDDGATNDAGTAAWLEVASRAMRARWMEGRLSSGARARGSGRACHPQSLVRFAVALAAAGDDGHAADNAVASAAAPAANADALPQVSPLAALPPLPNARPGRSLRFFRPSFNWLAGLCAESRRGLDALAPRELAALLWALARLGAAAAGAGGGAASSAAFVPEAAFLSSWCRASAVRMPAFDARSLSVAVEALAVLVGERGGGRGGRAPPLSSSTPPPFEVPGRLATAVLARSAQLLPRMRAERLAALLRALAALRVRPAAAWALGWLDAFSSAAFSAPATTPPPLPAALVADIAWSLARLRLDPGAAWLQQLYNAADAALPGASAADLAALCWAAAALPSESGKRGGGGGADEGEREEQQRGRPRRTWLAALGARARDAAYLAGGDAGGAGSPPALLLDQQRRAVEALAAFVADEVVTVGATTKSSPRARRKTTAGRGI